MLDSVSLGIVLIPFLSLLLVPLSKEECAAGDFCLAVVQYWGICVFDRCTSHLFHKYKGITRLALGGHSPTVGNHGTALEVYPVRFLV